MAFLMVQQEELHQQYRPRLNRRKTTCIHGHALKQGKTRKWCPECTRIKRAANPKPHKERKSAAERFWAKVDKTPGQGPKGECWEYKGAKGQYKRFWHNGHFVGAHRCSYELHYGAIPNSLFVCHHCDNPPCVRPTCLFVGMHEDNMADMDAKNRRRTRGSKWRQ